MSPIAIKIGTGIKIAIGIAIAIEITHHRAPRTAQPAPRNARHAA